MKRSHRELLDSEDFRRLVAKRWRVSLLLTALLFILYYGYILLVAADRALLSRRIGSGATTLGIPLGAAVIVGAWLLTAIYVAWANRAYDGEAARLKALALGAPDESTATGEPDEPVKNA